MKTNSALDVKNISVLLDGKLVGQLAETNEKKIAFSYSQEWLEDGFSLNPLYLPLEKKVFIPPNYNFDGLFGIFADSLPDAWGQLLLQRFLAEHGLDPNLNVLSRLCLVGTSGMGALEYVPSYDFLTDKEIKDIDYLASQCKKILTTEAVSDIDTLFKMGGSSGGARPKVSLDIDGHPWLIKFPARTDSDNIGEMEYQYSICAKQCGIKMSETHLFPSNYCSGYFGTKRFDRILSKSGMKKVHVGTASGILESDYRAPALDYNTIFKLTRVLTRENRDDVEMLFRLMCFNVFAHNRDDHGKNFSFIYNQDLCRWELAPAYDLTYSNTFFGEHTTSVNGNGKNPSKSDLLAVGIKAGLSKNFCVETIDEIESRLFTASSLFQPYHLI